MPLSGEKKKREKNPISQATAKGVETLTWEVMAGWSIHWASEPLETYWGATPHK